MKSVFILTVSFGLSLALQAQKTPVTKPKPVSSSKTAAAPKTAVSVLKTQEDSVNYVIGVSIANYYKQATDYYKQMGMTNINTELVKKTFNDILSGKTPLIDDNTANTCMNNYFGKLMAGKSQGNIDAGEKFLAENKKRPGVITTASGLQYEVEKEGTGIKPTAADTFVCHYRGTLLDGTEFDASYNRNQPLTMPVSDVIKGWTEGLQLMSVGSKYKFYIPYSLGYGTQTNGPIPGGSMLIFDVELLDVKKKQ